MARVGVKLRLSRSSWRAFASTYPIVLSSNPPREAVLACPPFSCWNLPLFTVESTLSSSCTRSDPPLSHQGAALSHLDYLLPHDLVLRTDGSVPPPVGKGGSGVIANCFQFGSEATFSFFSMPSMFKFFSLKPSPFCTLFADLGSTNMPPTVLLFFFYVTLVLSSPLCPLLRLFFYLNLCGRSRRNCLLSPPVLSRYNGSPDTRFSRGTTRPMRSALLAPSAFPLVSLLFSLVSTLVLSRTGGVLSHLNSLTHGFPQFSPKNLCTLVLFAMFSLVYAEADTAYWFLSL